MVDLCESVDVEKTIGSGVSLVDNREDMDDIDKDEVERDKLVEELFIYAVPPSDIRKKMQSVNYVEIEVRERFNSIGVEV